MLLLYVCRLVLNSYLCHLINSADWTDQVDHCTLIRTHCMIDCIGRCLSPSPSQVLPDDRSCRPLLDTHQLRKQLVHDRNQRWRLFEDYQTRVVQRFDAVYRLSAGGAARITQDIVDRQNDLRRTFLDTLRRKVNLHLNLIFFKNIIYNKFQ